VIDFKNARWKPEIKIEDYEISKFLTVGTQLHFMGNLTENVALFL